MPDNDDMINTVFLVQSARHYEPSTIHGIFSSVDAAQAAALQAATDGWCDWVAATAYDTSTGRRGTLEVAYYDKDAINALRDAREREEELREHEMGGEGSFC